jgi:predicted RNA-binding protein YlqC (UPF0109 family)
VDNPNAVRVSERELARTTILELNVDPADTGKVIGKEGRVAKALRVLLRIAAARQRRRVILEIA